MNISYLIAVHNEHEELKRLLDQLFEHIDLDDEIIIQGDQGKVTDAVISVIRHRLKDSRLKYIEFPLNRDFATFKNNLAKQAIKDYCFLIDADELLHPHLFSIKSLVEINPDVDVFIFPRFNVVKNLDYNYSKQVNWDVKTMISTDDAVKNLLQPFQVQFGDVIPNVVNFPDRQQRIWKNGNGIYYEGQVHERLVGFNNFAQLPVIQNTFSDPKSPVEYNLSFCIFHIKSFDRQKKQNEFYKSLEC